MLFTVVAVYLFECHCLLLSIRIIHLREIILVSLNLWRSFECLVIFTEKVVREATAVNFICTLMHWLSFPVTSKRFNTFMVNL